MQSLNVLLLICVVQNNIYTKSWLQLPFPCLAMREAIYTSTAAYLEYLLLQVMWIALLLWHSCHLQEWVLEYMYDH
jgi:hypothetical protein